MNTPLRLLAVAFALALLPLPPAAHGAPGDLDSAFGAGGKATTPIGSSTDIGQSVAVQGDGKLVVAGYSYNGTNNDFAVVRYTSSGALDTTFGTGGKVTTPVGSGDEVGYSVAVQGDGKIVVAGHSHNGTNPDFAVVRYTATGNLDTSFGSGGKVTTAVGSGNDNSYSVALQNDGMIVVVGGSVGASGFTDMTLVRYTSSGALDSSFGSGGKVTTPIGTGSSRGYSVAVQSDGEIVVAGHAFISGNNNDIAVARYTNTGALDSTFGTGGIVTTSITPNFSDYGQSVAVQSDGKVVVAGYTGSNQDFALVRYTAAGALDAGFGTGGKVTTPVGSGSDIGHSVAVQSDGKLVVAGYSFNNFNFDFALVRYTSSGALDTTFGTGGKVTTPIGSSDDYGFSVALQSDGKFVVAGQSTIGSNVDFAVARYTDTGALDSTFNAGKVTTPIGNGNDQANAVDVQSDGKIVAVGASHNGTNNDLALVRYLANGTVDTSFGGTGKITTSVGSGNESLSAVAMQSDGKIVVAGQVHNGTNEDFLVARYTSAGGLDWSVNTAFGTVDDAAYGMAIQPDGKIVVVGAAIIGSTFDFAVARYNTNGTLDTTFDGDGKVTTPITTTGQGYDYAQSVAVQPDGKIVVGGHTSDGTNLQFAAVRYNANGSLDTTFDGDGKVIIPVGSGDDVGTSLALQSDGKILLAGETAQGGFKDFALVRLNTNGSLDTTFHFDGAVGTAFNAFDDYGRSVKVQADGKIVVAGFTSTTSGTVYDMAVARYLSDGTLDSTFGSSGKVMIPIGSASDVGTSLALQADGNIVVAGYSNNGSNNDFAVVRLFGGPSELLVNGSFESAEALGGGSPTSFGDWKYDQAAIVTAENGITSFAGTRMLKFLGTEATSGGTDNICAVGQLVPMSAYASAIAAGSARAIVTARFNRVAVTDSEFLIELDAFSGTPTAPVFISAIAPSVFTDNDPATWQSLTASLNLPPGTTMLGVYVQARENLNNNPSLPEFDGNYADDVQLSVLVNQAPVAVAGGPYVIASGESLLLNGSASSDPNSAQGDSLANFEWDVNNDGTYETSGITPTVPWATLQSLLATPANYPADPVTGFPSNTVRLRVTDSFGATHTATTTLKIYNNQPVANATATPNPVGYGVVASFSGAGSTHGHPDHSIVSYAWNFGDGATATGESVSHGFAQAGLYTVTLTVTDDNVPPKTATNNVVVTVTDAVPPVLTLPANIIAEATSAAGRVVTYSASASDPGSGVASFSALPVSGSTFPLGTTTVNVSATDNSGNTNTGSFTVTVRDTTAPVVGGNFSPLTLTTGMLGMATLPDYLPQAVITDAVGVVNVAQSPEAGTPLIVGTRGVGIAAGDAAGNIGTTAFQVTVLDGTAPVLTLPVNQIVEATSGVGAVVTFTATATDNATVSPTIVATPASGSTFPMGKTTVNVTATDAAGNSASGSFTVTVRDTTAPTLTLPDGPLLAGVTSAQGAVVSFTVTAADVVDGVVTPTAIPPSGSTFPIGDTTVQVTATDAAGNVARGSFIVRVSGTLDFWFVQVFDDATSFPSVTNLATADALIASGARVAYGSVSQADLLGNATGATDGHFNVNLPVPGSGAGNRNDYAVKATARFVVPTEGDYTFAANTDDGVRVRIDGQTVIVDDRLHSATDSEYVAVHLTAGEHAIEWVWFEHLGQDEAELFAAPGVHTGFGPEFKLVGTPGLFEAPMGTAPEIVVEQPADSSLMSGTSSVNLGPTVVGSSTTKTFTVKNTGTGDLTGLGITFDGADAARFTVTTNVTAPVASARTTTFTVTFTPTTSGTKTAALNLETNDADENPFEIALTARVLSATEDTDGDGLNDAAEFKLAAIGFDWQESQPALVSAFLADAGLFTQTQIDASRAAGRTDVTGNPDAFNLYTLSAVQDLYIETPLIVQDLATGKWKLTIGVKKSTNLIDYTPLPFVHEGTAINAQGKLEFDFTVPERSAFFRLHAR